MTKPNLSSEIEAFLARGGAIQTVAAGERTGAVSAAYAAGKAFERGSYFDQALYAERRAEGCNHADAARQARFL